MDTRKVSIDVPVLNGPHGACVAGSLRRVSECLSLIIAAKPISVAKLIRLLSRAETDIDGITIPEIEYASYLAGMADREVQ